MTLITLNYNNYYNRIVKDEGTTSWDSNWAQYQVGQQLNINFNPNDGIMTKQVVNMNPEDIGDYCILLDDDSNIISRWFIMDYTRLRNGQYELVLKRDVLGESYKNVLNMPMFVERGYVEANSPLILNKEDLSMNKIKAGEYFLIDPNVECSWIVGYVAKNKVIDASIPVALISSDGSIDATLVYKTYTSEDAFYNDIYNDTNQFTYYTNVYYKVGYGISRGSTEFYTTSTYDQNFNYLGYSSSSIGQDFQSSIVYYNDTEAQINNLGNSLEESSIQTAFNTAISGSGYALDNTIQDIRGKLVNIAGVYYNVNFSESTIDEVDVDLSMAPNVNQAIKNNVSTTMTLKRDGLFGTGFSAIKHIITVTLSQVEGLYTYYHNQDKRIHCADALYDIFCIPYKSNGSQSITINETSTSGQTYTLLPDLAIATANAIQTTMGNEVVVDLQLLPYCPLRDKFYNNEITYPSDRVQSSNGISLPILWANQSILSFDVKPNLNDFVQDLDYENKYRKDSIGKKMCNELFTNRLCSPNMGSFFEFSKTSLGKAATKYNVDMVFKPYSPYIHINPIFSGYYGKDFNDTRGLICEGEFSLTQTSNAWQEYELQNKNYQSVFNRQMQNMDTNYEISKQEAVWSTIANSVSGSVQGGVAGSLVGGPIGATIGAVGGGIASTIGGIMDLQNMESRYNEQKSYATDNFNMQLDNIKALPNTITKLSAINNNNKIWPFLEVYTCTSKEKSMYLDYISYKGMKNGSVSTILSSLMTDKDEIEQYNYHNYVKGKLIRINVDEDTHYLNVLADELNQGVYFEYLIEKGEI